MKRSSGAGRGGGEVVNRASLFYVMNPDFSKNHFELFGFKPGFAINVAALDIAYREVQREVHPDRFATATDAEKRLAAQWATQANGAYRTLKSPLNRGRYLLQLNGIDTEEERNTAMPLEFLVQQMEWREALDEARGSAQVESLHAAVGRHHDEALRSLQQMLDERRDYPAAAQQVRALMFVERFAADVDERREALET